MKRVFLCTLLLSILLLASCSEKERYEYSDNERYICIFLKNLSITDIIWYDEECSLKADDFRYKNRAYSRRMKMVIKDMVHITPYHLERMLHIYLPDDYEESEARYPVMYMYDGHNLFYNEDATYGKSWGLQEFMRQWENQLIIVGIECNHEGNKRLEEFSPYDFRDFDGQRIHGTGKIFMQWVVDELKPLIDSHFRTKPEREYTGIGGSSMGGLMAYYTVVAHNDVFSKAACLSSAVGFCYDAMREELTAAGPLLSDTRVYMSWGSKESGRKPGLVKYTCTNLEFSHLLVERGAVTYPYHQAFGGHCEADWEKQNAIYMPFLWNGVFEDGME